MAAAPHVIVGLSGGVDSSVTAYLLKEQGYRVSGLFMVNWTEDEQGYCTSADDFQDARAVCAELDIALHRVDFSREYRERVFAHFLADYAAGKTPNPDVLCNREVKFAPFREHALRLGADYIATGHYASIEHRDDGPQLLRAVDDNKDQTYFLAGVERAQFERVLFPLGGLRKPEVRQIATRAGLTVHRKKDSTGICFIGEREFRDFLANYLKPDPGPIVDDRGREIGRHQGLMYYTLGQRRGLGIGGTKGASEAPWYVVGKAPADKALIVAQDPAHPQLMARSLLAAPFNALGPLPTDGRPLQARIRHRGALADCRISAERDGLRVEFLEPQRAAVDGQFCVLYDGARCLGGGEIGNVKTLA
ncbi:tRNA 2-thiouridine(34) synthase MnmA [Solimonas marina]|uniref:tRNA-specific 2-thiouridylase MnmA n=1 Tax=Solimonas marina TaxID=2714601 RepID=A0A969WD05_9GAMM|nr:tRNA 2-thiouridine(34) synthase MnmA [Solimonas marina]